MKVYLSTIKELIFLSALFGAALGIATLIPYIGLITFLICTFAAGSTVIFYMQKLKLLNELDIKEWSINGAISGFVSFIGFSITFIPLAALIGALVKTSYYYGITIMFKNGFFLLLFLILFVAITSALTNGFGSMVTASALKFYKTQIENK